MATVVNTLIDGLNQQMVQARLNGIDAKPFQFAKYFPVKRVFGFNFSMLSNQITKPNVAGELHSDNASIVRKRRPLFNVVRGDIPMIGISREMSRSELKNYQNARAFAKDKNAIDLADFWGADVDYCFNGVNSELEYIAWALLSNAGKLAFTTTNSATFANNYDLDYDVDASTQKKYTSTNWGTADSADVIGDLASIISGAKSAGLNPKFGFVNLATFYKIASADQIKKMCASLGENLSGAMGTPGLDKVNQILAGQAWLNGLQLRVIDQTVTREFADGTSTSANPFADDRLVLSASENLGSTQYDILEENNPAIIRAERAHVVVKKYGQAEPTAEITIGQADAIPVLDSAYSNIYVKTDGNAWS